MPEGPMLINFEECDEEGRPLLDDGELAVELSLTFHAYCAPCAGDEIALPEYDEETDELSDDLTIFIAKKIRHVFYVRGSNYKHEVIVWCCRTEWEANKPR